MFSKRFERLNNPDGIPFGEWMAKRGLSYTDLKGRTDDLQAASIFPLVNSAEELGLVLR